MIGIIDSCSLEIFQGVLSTKEREIADSRMCFSLIKEPNIVQIICVKS